MIKLRTLTGGLLACLAVTATATATTTQTSTIRACPSDDVSSCVEKTIVTTYPSFGDRKILEITPPEGAPTKITLEKSETTLTYPLEFDHTVEFAPKAKPHPTDVPVIFAAYRLGKPVRFFRIKVEFTVGSQNHRFDITPNQPVKTASEDTDSNFALKAALLGETQPYRAAPALANHFLFIPISPPDHPYVQYYYENMMLVPREEVSWMGTECNKVGFRSRYRFARKRCLHYQLDDKHAADLQKLDLNPDAASDYLVRGLRDFDASVDYSAPSPVLIHTVRERTTATVALAIDPAEVADVAVESEAEVRVADVVTFDSHSRDGVLEVFVKNVGNATADYLVTVSDCSARIVGPPAKAVTLEPNINYEERVTFELHTDRNVQSAHFCFVSVRLDTGTQLYREPVLFNTYFQEGPPTPP